jgi:hypothetical protein
VVGKHGQTQEIRRFLVQGLVTLVVALTAWPLLAPAALVVAIRRARRGEIVVRRSDLAWLPRRITAAMAAALIVWAGRGRGRVDLYSHPRHLGPLGWPVLLLCQGGTRFECVEDDADEESFEAAESSARRSQVEAASPSSSAARSKRPSPHSGRQRKKRASHQSALSSTSRRSAGTRSQTSTRSCPRSGSRSATQPSSTNRNATSETWCEQ